jgi:polyhydroxyalkanoate synthase subunit PhaC
MAPSSVPPKSSMPNKPLASVMKAPDPIEFSRKFSDILMRGQKLVADFYGRHEGEMPKLGMGDHANVSAAFWEAATKMWADPTRLFQAQVNLWQSYFDLWQHTMVRFMGGDSKPIIEAQRGDKRFKDPVWQESAMFDFIKQSYLLSAQWLQGVVQNIEGLDEKTSRKIDFYTKQFVDAISPSNFAYTNPEVLRATLETGGENLLAGLENLIEDLERGQGQLKISMTDLDAFTVGKNLATTPGKVVFRNDLMELIQYAPTGKETFETPLLILPPWINKYYILDMRPENSYVKWAVDQGHTVFLVSWINPDARAANKSFEDYMKEGPLAALNVIQSITGKNSINAIGYCLGGTLLACLLAWMQAKGDKRINSATFFTTMVDFDEAGDLEVFIDESQIAALEERMSKKGYLEGQDMATTFNMLRANDLIWSFVVNNYLLGKEPFPFDLLYWNSDSTRMPAAMHSFYLRNMYQQNKLVQKGGVTLDGVPIDLSTITTPCFFLSTAEDHIAPWKSTYAATQLYKGDRTFVLTGSGHIAGVVNPPAANKYCYWTNNKLPASADEWFASSARQEGSWWPEWQRWIAPKAGKKITPPSLGNATHKPMDDAPGTYVKVRY